MDIFEDAPSDTIGTAKHSSASLPSPPPDAPDAPHVQESNLVHLELDHTPPRVVGGQGPYLILEDGTKVFDATGGAAVSCIGHGNLAVKQAIVEQLEITEYCFAPFFTTAAAENLANLLMNTTSGEMTRTFLTGSGTEAIEAALKLARQYFLEAPEPQPQRHRFIARKNSYHGNSLGALSVSHHVARSSLYGPLLSPNVSHVSACNPYRDLREGESISTYVARLADELEAEFQRVGPDQVCAFVAETVSGGTMCVVPAPPGYWKAMKAVCERHGALLILDEIACGMGRTGSTHAWEQEEGLVPHLQTVAKGLGAGYSPISALLIHRDIVDRLLAGSKSFAHSQTYQAHPVACAAAFAVQQVVRDNHLVSRSREMGEKLGTLLQQRLGSHPNVGDIRGRGLMWGVELVADRSSKAPFPAEDAIAWKIHVEGMKRQAISLFPCDGIIDGSVGDGLLIAPPFTISETEVELIVDRAATAIETVLGP